MRHLIPLLLLSFPHLSSAAAPPGLPESVVLGVRMNRSFRIPSLVRAAVGDGKLLKVRAVTADTLLITGLRPGRTTLRAWAAGDQEYACEVEVLSPELHAQYGSIDGTGVVKVALEFLELDGALSDSLGIRWPETIHFQGGANLQGNQATSGLNYTLSFTSARAWIHHLLKKGWGKILARPELYVRLGEEAVFHSGGEFPVPASVENYGGRHKHIEWKNFGLSVKVRPRSGDRLHIASDISVEISEIHRGMSAEGVPALSRRKLDTKMSSLDGETVVLSGLVRRASALEKDEVPLLSAIPLLGPLLFSSERRTEEESELLMALTLSLATKGRVAESLERFRGRFDAAVPPR